MTQKKMAINLRKLLILLSIIVTTIALSSCTNYSRITVKDVADLRDLYSFGAITSSVVEPIYDRVFDSYVRSYFSTKAIRPYTDTPYIMLTKLISIGYTNLIYSSDWSVEAVRMTVGVEISVIGNPEYGSPDRLSKKVYYGSGVYSIESEYDLQYSKDLAFKDGLTQALDKFYADLLHTQVQ